MTQPKRLLLSAVTLAVLTLISQAHAQQTASAVQSNNGGPRNAAEDKAEEKMDQVIVTGSTSLKRTVRESSVAVTAADREDLDRKAPRSTASALELIPGMTVEDSGGEVSNNYTVRGLAGGGQNFVQLSEDGLPIFYHPGLADTILRQEVSIDRLEAVRGGTSGILTVNGAGATVNFLTHRAKDTAEGMLRLTGSDYGTKRVDVRYGGPLGNGWYAGLGGYYRSSDSVRDTQFTADHGGLFRAYLGRKFSDGEFSVNLKVVDEHNTFLLPTPFENPRDPRPTPGFDGNYGTMISADNAVQAGRSSNGPTVNDATDAVATRATAIGYAFEKQVGEGLTLRSKGRYTDFKNEFNAIFTFDNDSLRPAAQRLDPSRNADIATMLARFPGTTPGIRGVASGIIYTGAQLGNVGGNGLVTDNISAKNRLYRQVFVNDLSLTWSTPSNSLTGGLLMFDHRAQSSNDGNTRFLGEVRDNPARLDIVAVDAAGRVAGQLTDKSILQYNPWGVGTERSELTSQNLYVNDEFKFSERLRLDAGMRYEKLHYRAWQPQGATMAIPGATRADGSDADNIMVNNEAVMFNGLYNHIDKGAANHTSLTAGGNYLVSDNLAAYARYSQSYQAQNENPVTEINFGELGARYKRKGLAVGLTLFRTTFKDFQYSRRIGSDFQDTRVNGDIIVNGVEYDVLWRPIRMAQVALTGVYQKAKLSVKGVSGPSAGTINLASIGARPERSPELNLTLTPSLMLPDNKGEVYLSYHHVGKRFADAGNTFVLPAYNTLNAGARYQISDDLTFHISAQNLRNTIGLTEGNPRAGFTEVGAGNYFFARAILGRNLQASLTVSF